jgi:hypothetical protein
MRTIRFGGLLMVLGGALLCRPDAASAQASPDVQQACTPDAMRLCGEFIPDVPKITACMTRKHAQLSHECRTAMAAGHHRGRHGHRHHAKQSAT